MEGTQLGFRGLLRLWRWESQKSFPILNPHHYCSWRSFSQSLCSPGAREVKPAVWVGKENWRKLTGMGGARGGADQEPSFLLSTQASSPRLTPTPFGPYSPQELRVPVLLPNPSYPLPHRFLPSRVWRLRDPRKKRMVSSIRVPIRMSMAGPPRAPALGLGGLPLRPLLLQGLALQPWGPARPPCSPCRPSSFWTWWQRPSPAA